MNWAYYQQLASSVWCCVKKKAKLIKRVMRNHEYLRVMKKKKEEIWVFTHLWGNDHRAENPQLLSFFDELCHETTISYNAPHSFLLLLLLVLHPNSSHLPLLPSDVSASLLTLLLLSGLLLFSPLFAIAWANPWSKELQNNSQLEACEILVQSFPLLMLFFFFFLFYNHVVATRLPSTKNPSLPFQNSLLFWLKACSFDVWSMLFWRTLGF